MSKKAWIIFAAICVVVLGGLVYLSSRNKVDVSSVDVTKQQKASDVSGGIGEHVFGKTDSKVVLMEYGDFQCPGCGAAYPSLKTISEKYKGQIAFVFRNFPLTSVHPNAKAAAAAAEAAGLQDKYWEMHNMLYENQSSWENLSADKRIDYFAGYALQLGLDVSKFKKDVAGDAVNKKISYDQALGRKANVSATPTILINNKPVDQHVKNGQIVDANTSDSQFVWADADTLDKLIIQPALKEAGINLPQQ